MLEIVIRKYDSNSVEFGFRKDSDQPQSMQNIPSDVNNAISVIFAYLETIKTEKDKTEMALAFIKENATPEQKLALLDIYPIWKSGEVYRLGQEIRYMDKLYSVIQPGEHTAQADWVPDKTPALYWPIQPASVIGEWVQPIGGSGTYVLGAKVLYKGQVYENIFTGDTYNVWSPEGYPQGWKLVP